MIIKDWLYAIAVCRKYKIWWNPFVKRGEGWYLWSGVICVNPFDRYFLTTFLHELGHHVHNKRVVLKNYLKAQDSELRFVGGNESGRSIYRVLEGEATASRFAVKTGKANRKELVKCFNTYSASIFEHTHKPIVVNEISNIVDCVHKCIRRIEK